MIISETDLSVRQAESMVSTELRLHQEAQIAIAHDAEVLALAEENSTQ